ncbi:MAG: 4Fe-4S dicluster domain-containing protein [Candidatus Lokiarchaeota archaeon]|nr:4Fe-4S dicluster domain-containing protein [Candidatus Lokiarchaeota archaeon]MBD3202419.1 4Fe-4S dicluster domain-containing protein [Candidatus Lokiarchaeota archaeon]
MKYRKMGSLGWNVSTLGFGAMRLPTDNENRIKENESIRMIRYGIKHGINYIDTAFPYHQKQSEPLVGKALKDGYRDKVWLTTKLPMWLINKERHFERYFKRQQKRLQTNPDIYLFHGLNNLRFQKVKDLDLIPKMEKLRDEGIIKHFGFSFHDSIDVFKEIIDFYDWDCCQIQLNYLDINYQAGMEGLRYAGKKNIAVIIMEPLRGGKLTIPDEELENKPEIKEVLKNSDIQRSMADWGLQFLWNQPEVSVVLSGMSEMQHVIENVKSADMSGINILSQEELNTIKDLRNAYQKYDVVPCTSCGYCTPCPQGVSIPFVMRILNEVGYWREEKFDTWQTFYERFAKTPEELEERRNSGEEVQGGPSLCIECGQCLEHCPQGIDIPGYMKNVVELFEHEKDIQEVIKS